MQTRREAAGPHTHRSTRPSCMEPHLQRTKNVNQEVAVLIVKQLNAKAEVTLEEVFGFEEEEEEVVGGLRRSPGTF